VVVAVDPAANRTRVVLEEGGDLGGGEAAQGEPDHHQAQGVAPGALEQGHDLELAIGGRLGEDVGRTQEWTWPRWGWWKAPTRLLLPLPRGNGSMGPIAGRRLPSQGSSWPVVPVVTSSVSQHGSSQLVDRLPDRAKARQVTLIDRNRAGELSAVWDELVAMGARVREPELLPGVVAVAEETMRRARVNVERLIDLLPRHGWQFQFPPTGPPGRSVWALPSSETPAQLSGLPEVLHVILRRPVWCGAVVAGVARLVWLLD
jgi:hypothetical protein